MGAGSVRLGLTGCGEERRPHFLAQWENSKEFKSQGRLDHSACFTENGFEDGPQSGRSELS